MNALLLLLACSRPPEAPRDLYDLGNYLFMQHPEEDPAAREAGMDRLAAWLADSSDQASQGYEVAGLNDAAVVGLDGDEFALDGIFGVAVATSSDHDVDAYAHALLEVNQEEVAPERYESFQRTWSGDLDCFMEHDCDRIESTEEVDINLPFGVESQQGTSNQYVWVEADVGSSLLQRSWLPEPGDLSMDFLEVDEQFYLNAVLPREGGAWRLQITWLVPGDSVAPESTLMDMSADSMVELADFTETWLDDND